MTLPLLEQEIKNSYADYLACSEVPEIAIDDTFHDS